MNKPLNSFEDIERALSLERFSRYVAWAGGDRNRALELYTLNTKISESLYPPLQMLEVALRNRIHTVMSEIRHEEWFKDDGFLLVEHQKAQLAKAAEDLAAEKKGLSPGAVVAALTFSFWTSMLSPEYENLWQQHLNRIARKANGKGLRRKDLTGPLRPIRTLRNRIAHHEPILSWNLPRHYANMLQITEWLSPPAAAWCHEHCRFPEVYPSERIRLEGS
ncbi:MAG: Abi family protein [Hyphomicrobiales bacterium]|nr:Abi family protein [Hyphomicrobiales bacterium]